MLTRFAPAPTGYLHLGHVVNARYVWQWARALGGKVLLRIDDHDGARSRPEFEAALLDDLDWLGFEPDLYPTSTFRHGPCESRQSDRQAIYAASAARLAEQGLLYGCTCSRQDIARMPDVAAGAERRYPGTCRARGAELVSGVGWRMRLEPGLERFDDRLCGRHVQDPAAQCGDVLIRDRDGFWTYQFVTAVDDHAQGITHVCRGLDLLSSTGRQIAIARALGRATPAAFAHHPLVMKSATAKLSKSDGDTGVRDLRRAGWTAGQVIEEADRRARDHQYFRS